MKQTNQLVSIVLPVCNAGMYLPKALDSLIKQTYNAIEIIAIDDNSKDDSFAILKRYKRTDSRIRAYKNKKRYGLAVCYNRAIRRAKGQFIAFMDPFDISALHRIQRQRGFLLRNPKIAGVGTQVTKIDDRDRKLAKSTLPKEHGKIQQSLLPGAGGMQYETVMINRHLLPKDVLTFKNTTYPFLFTDVFLRLFQYGQFANLAQYLYYKRNEGNILKVKATQRVSSFLKLVVRSVAEYDHRPRLRSLVAPLVKDA